MRLPTLLLIFGTLFLPSATVHAGGLPGCGCCGATLLVWASRKSHQRTLRFELVQATGGAKR
jgi:hypothetical protein